MLRLSAARLTLPSDKKSFMEFVKTLRYRTEAPISDCSAALKEANGDIEAAMQVLRRKGAARAMKKGDRVTEHGFVVSCRAANPADGAAIITLCSETDFAARNMRFQETCRSVQQSFQEMLRETQGRILSSPEDATKALADATVSELRAAIAVLGENIRIRGVAPLRISPHVVENITIGTYTHGTLELNHIGRIVGLVAVSCLQPAQEVPEDVLTSVARHFVATSGAEGSYTNQTFFGGTDGETVGKWMKRHGLRFSSSLVMEFGKEPVEHSAAAPHISKQ